MLSGMLDSFIKEKNSAAIGTLEGKRKDKVGRNEASGRPRSELRLRAQSSMKWVKIQMRVLR